MKLQLVETKKSSGDWLYIYDCKEDGTRTFVDCLILHDDNRDEQLKRATEIMGFYLENRGSEKIIKEFEYTEI